MIARQFKACLAVFVEVLAIADSAVCFASRARTRPRARMPATSSRRSSAVIVSGLRVVSA
ncbi:MAG: hypothetical protein D6692_13725 [Planctomycetota bacterium]|nr:MAG: hypothetical protein D6692_13725 [Planctomycetota bacterium]